VGVEYVSRLDPSFIVDYVNELFDMAPTEVRARPLPHTHPLPIQPPRSSNTPVDAALQLIQRVIGVVVDTLPGLLDLIYMLGMCTGSLRTRVHV
jgi:hypothetical protein